jgi:hypothetical protein
MDQHTAALERGSELAFEDFGAALDEPGDDLEPRDRGDHDYVAGVCEDCEAKAPGFDPGVYAAYRAAGEHLPHEMRSPGIVYAIVAEGRQALLVRRSRRAARRLAHALASRTTAHVYCRPNTAELRLLHAIFTNDAGRYESATPRWTFPVRARVAS